MKIELFTDGGARGNPGPAAAGIVIKTQDLEYHYGLFLGDKTNNQAEYMALCFGLEFVKSRLNNVVIDSIQVKMDSELVVKQLNGDYKVKDVDLRVIFEKVQELVLSLPMVQFSHVPREENALADKIVNNVLDIQHGVNKNI